MKVTYICINFYPNKARDGHSLLLQKAGKVISQIFGMKISASDARTSIHQKLLCF